MKDRKGLVYITLIDIIVPLIIMIIARLKYNRELDNGGWGGLALSIMIFVGILMVLVFIILRYFSYTTDLNLKNSIITGGIIISNSFYIAKLDIAIHEGIILGIIIFYLITYTLHGFLIKRNKEPY